MASTAPASKRDTIFFSAGDQEFSARDVIDAAHFRGEIEASWRELLRRLEAERMAEESGDEPDGAELDAASIAFRYRYDLITAEETEAWLAARGLTLADFGDYFTREQWGKAFAGETKAQPVKFEEASTELRELLTVELVMSGALEAMATALAWRVAARAAAASVEAEAIAEERKDFFARHVLNEEEIAHWLRGLDRDESWWREMMEMEAAFRARHAQQLTDEARKRELGSVRLPLTRFQLETIELESRDAAREAFMCVRDDGMGMAEVAQEGRYPFREMEMTLEEIPEELQQKFLSLTPGSLLEPSPRDDGFVLTRMLAKREPTLADDDVRARVETRILRRHFDDLAAGHVRWRLSLNSSSA